MDNLNENWLDDILGHQPSSNPAEPDSQEVMAPKGLDQQDDLELERIVQETIAQNWGADFPHHQEDPQASDPDATQFFAPQQTIPDSVFTPEEPNIPFPDAQEADGITNDDATPVVQTTDTPVEDPEEPVQEDESPAVSESADIVSQDDLLIDELIQSGILEQPEALTEDGSVAAEQESVTEEDFTNDEPVRKTRPKKKKGDMLWGLPHLFSTGVWAAIIIFVGITLGRTIWLCAVDVLALGKTGREVTIVITENDSVADVANKLESVGMIQYSSLFETFAKITGKGDQIKPGTITFDAKIVYDYNALINAMSADSGPTNTVTVTIPEGYNCKQIFALLEEKGVCSAKDLEQYAASGELPDYWFLKDLKRGTKYCLEGYLFPDTYDFYLDDTPKNVIKKFLEDFDFRFSERLREKYNHLNNDLGLGLSVHEVVIMASMVQKEKANDEEGYVIASVFYNRMVDSMKNPNSKYHFLGCDATIDYAESVYPNQNAIINSYDTYKNRGLPPGPICNPGLSSLDAALEPNDSSVDTNNSKKFYYFVLDKEQNEHRFAVTQAEHDKNLRELGYYD